MSTSLSKNPAAGYQNHIQVLQTRHEVLSKKIEEAERAPGLDSLYIKTLKLEKLRIKEEIEGIIH
jgi:hypothetical protein